MQWVMKTCFVCFCCWEWVEKNSKENGGLQYWEGTKQHHLNTNPVLKEINLEFDREMIWTIFKWPQVANVYPKIVSACPSGAINELTLFFGAYVHPKKHTAQVHQAGWSTFFGLHLPLRVLIEPYGMVFFNTTSHPFSTLWKILSVCFLQPFLFGKRKTSNKCGIKKLPPPWQDLETTIPNPKWSCGSPFWRTAAVFFPSSKNWD